MYKNCKFYDSLCIGISKSFTPFLTRSGFFQRDEFLCTVLIGMASKERKQRGKMNEKMFCSCNSQKDFCQLSQIKMLFHWRVQRHTTLRIHTDIIHIYIFIHWSQQQFQSILFFHGTMNDFMRRVE